MKIFNTLSRNLEEFKPLKDNEVSLYTCGPTVYHFAHIGNLRAFIFYDTLKRVLQNDGYKVKHVMNITDVGHLVADDDRDDSGEDKMEKGARREGKSVWDVAKYYTDAYLSDVRDLNILPPTFQPKATEYIQQQIDLIKNLEDKGFTYRTSTGIAYDTSKFPNYNKLSRMNLEQLEEGARVEADPEKKHTTDFYLWKFSPTDHKREMEWDSPWGVGFPGWHLECSAMAISLLGETIDIHTGGIDHIPVHHTNEIAQSEGATGKQFSNYWMHNNFLVLTGGAKMAKSGDNFMTLTKVKEMGFEPMVFRYYVLTAKYSSELEFTEEALHAAKQTLNSIRRLLYDHPETIKRSDLATEYTAAFMEAMNNDLDTPAALSVLHEMLRSNLSDEEKRQHLLKFDEVLGLRLIETLSQSEYLDANLVTIEGVTAQNLIQQRNAAREAKEWNKADAIRDTIKKSGYELEDTSSGTKLKHS